MSTKQTEALKLAQDWYDSGNENSDDFANVIKQIIALAEQPAQQEPVAWASLVNEKIVAIEIGAKATPFGGSVAIPLYTSPQPSKPWVGLTDEELRDAYLKVTGDQWCLGGMSNAESFYEIIEANLKEKNT